MKSILCYGDSNTWGYIPASAEERYPYAVRWTGILQKMLGENGRVIEEGLNGRTTCFDDPTWPGRNGYEGLCAVLESHFPLDLVVIMLGSNDAKQIFPGKPYACGRALERYVKMIRCGGYGPGKGIPQILIVSPILIKPSVISESFEPEAAAAFTQQLGGVYRRYAEAMNVHFLDAAAIAEADDADGLHLNPQGHRAVAEALFHEICGILGL